MKEAISKKPSSKLFRSCHLFQRLMDLSKRMKESTIANLTGFYFVQCLQRTKDQPTHLTISWLGKMEKSSQNQRTTVSSTSMIWTVLCRDQSSTSLAQKLKTFRCFLRLLDMRFLSGPKIWTTHLARVTMVNTLFNMWESIKERIDITSLCSITRFKTLSGLQMAKSSSLSPGSNRPQQLCTMLMVNQCSSLERDLETPSKCVLLDIRSCSVGSETSPKVKWTFGV